MFKSVDGLRQPLRMSVWSLTNMITISTVKVCHPKNEQVNKSVLLCIIRQETSEKDELYTCE